MLLTSHSSCLLLESSLCNDWTFLCQLATRTLHIVSRNLKSEPYTLCRVELHCQKADQAEIAKSERIRSDRLRVALRKFFLSPANSIWVLAAKLFPFLVPILRVLASLLPDKLLVSYLLHGLHLHLKWLRAQIQAQIQVFTVLYAHSLLAAGPR